MDKEISGKCMLVHTLYTIPPAIKNIQCAGAAGGGVRFCGGTGRPPRGGPFALAIPFLAFNFFVSCCFTDSTYRHILLLLSSFCFQLVLGLPPPPSIRTFELYGPGTVFAVHRCHLGRTGTYYFYFSNILFYFILFLFQA